MENNKDPLPGTNNNAAPQQPPAEKKKPGRPRKQNTNTTIAFVGIVDKPNNEENGIEIIYNNPIMFKKIYAILKSFEVSQADFIFGPTDLQIQALDHQGETKIYTVIRGECMNLYYCQEPVRITMTRASMDKVFSSIDKSNYMFCMSFKKNNFNSMYIISADSPYLSKDIYQIDVDKKHNIVDEDFCDDFASYPVKFELNHRFIKTKIINLHKVGGTMTIAMIPDHPLQISLTSTRQVQVTSQFENNELIKLDNKLEVGKSLVVQVSIASIKPFTSNSNNENVHIAIDAVKPISLSTNIDQQGNKWAATVSVFTYAKDNDII